MSLESMLVTFNKVSETHIQWVTGSPSEAPDQTENALLTTPLLPHGYFIFPACEQRAAQQFLALYLDWTTPQQDEVLAYFKKESPTVPDLLKHIEYPHRWLLLTLGPQPDLTGLETLLNSQLTLLWTHQDGHFKCLLQDHSDLSELLPALLDTCQSELGLSATGYLGPAVMTAQALRHTYDLVDLMATLNAKPDGLLTFEDCAAELVAHQLLQSSAPLYPYWPLKALIEGLDDDLLKTAEAFLKHHLNMTDTAKALFLHRNTLLYRIDKIQKITGFDLRQFHDSWLFRLLLALRQAQLLQ